MFVISNVYGKNNLSFYIKSNVRVGFYISSCFNKCCVKCFLTSFVEIKYDVYLVFCH